MLDYALVFDGSKEPIKAVVVDIGLGGLQLRSKERFSIGARCRIHIGRASGEPLILNAEICHSSMVQDSELAASGVRFCPETHEDRLAIAEYVHGVFQRQCDKLLI